MVGFAMYHFPCPEIVFAKLNTSRGEGHTFCHISYSLRLGVQIGMPPVKCFCSDEPFHLAAKLYKVVVTDTWLR